MRYGIPDFKLDKTLIDRRVGQLKAEGVEFRTGVAVTSDFPGMVCNLSTGTMPASKLLKSFDAVVLAGGSEVPRDLPIPGRDLKGVHFAMEFLPLQNRVVAGDSLPNQLRATGKHVVVIGGGVLRCWYFYSAVVTPDRTAWGPRTGRARPPSPSSS